VAKKSAKAGKIDRIWLKSYPEIVPAEIGPLKFSSVAELLISSCKKFGDKPAFTCMDKTLSYNDIENLSGDFAAWLQSKGLKKGDRVAIMLPNILQYPIAAAGVLRAGLVVVNVNPLYTPRELEHQLKDSGAKAIIVLENFATTVEQVIEHTDIENVVVASMGDMLGLKGHIVNFVVRYIKKLVPAFSLPGHVTFKEVLAAGDRRGLTPVDISPDDVAFLQYTGGTTGVSKGATLSNSNILSNVEQNALWVEVAYQAKGRPENLTYVCALPLYHIFALTVNALMGMEQGARNILIPNPRDVDAFVAELAKYTVHVFPSLNTLFISLMNNKKFTELDMSSLVLSLGGGMAVQKSVAEEWQELTGCIISEGYGLSETSPVATANRFDGTKFSGTIGLPMPSTDIAIRDEDGNDVPLGEVGEICIRGPQVMVGYWQRPEATAHVMTDDGFFKSGDMGFMNETGQTKIVDRKKDMILVSGFNVYPNEIEEVVAEHPGVLEAAAIGVPDEYSGEVVKLFVVKKDPNLTVDDIKAHCKKTMTGYKRPKFIEFIDELPKSNVGKVLRRKLRDAELAK
jgi:long-chain acyl-CoA synthetase